MKHKIELGMGKIFLKKAKIGFLLLSICTAFAATNVIAQDAELTDEELTKYANVMAFADMEKAKMQEKYNEMIKAEEVMAGGKRFKEIKGTKGDADKLAAIGITPEEQAAYDQIQGKYDEMAKEFKEAYTAKIKDKELLGAAVYNKVNRALKSDSGVKERYEAILAQVKAEENEDEKSE